MKNDIRREITLAQGVAVKKEGSLLSLQGPKGIVQRHFFHPQVTITLEAGKIVLAARRASKREKTMIGSFEAHISNMVRGVQEPHLYQLKICSGHFPMNVTVTKEEIIIKNFLGESVPRKAKLLSGAEVKISGNEITVSSPDKEVAGQMAARIEQLCRVTKRDIRIFQDGCYITHKAGKGALV